MRGARKRFDRRAYRKQRRPDQAPRAPATFDPLAGKCHRRVRSQRRADLFVILGFGAGIKVNGNEITDRRQAFRLSDDPFRVFVAQQDVSDSSHFGNSISPNLWIVRKLP